MKRHFLLAFLFGMVFQIFLGIQAVAQTEDPKSGNKLPTVFDPINASDVAHDSTSEATEGLPGVCEHCGTTKNLSSVSIRDLTNPRSQGSSNGDKQTGQD